MKQEDSLRIIFAEYRFKVVGQMAFDFCYLFFFSMAFGLFTGFGLSYLFKIYESFNRQPIKETSLILMNGYFTYLFGELIGLSGIISLFTCAIIMGHYCFMNIS
jgi:NhaP-type Na+/H+ or K+/H+ antiporter